MSVLIKGMEKPKFCFKETNGEYEYCPFLDNDSNCVHLLKYGICNGNETWEDLYSKCLLVEVPEPHGRLIDADEIIKKMDEMNVRGVVFGTAVDYVKLIVNDAPTIIEAEGK